MKDKIFGVLQRVGRSFMLPIAILPVAGLLLGIGSSFTNETTIATYGLSKVLGEGTFLHALLIIMNKVGSAVFDNLPIIFAVGVAALHNRFYKIVMPNALSFFGGTRFVPIISILVYMFVGIALYFIWPAVQTVQGGQNIFFAQLADSANIMHFSADATRYFSGEFIFMIFGLPGAALAMYQCAKPEKKKAAGGLLLSASLASMMTGITEPIEFSFLFVAPVLFVVQVIFLSLRNIAGKC